MQQTIARTSLLEAISVRLGVSPVVALLGARQVTEQITAMPLREIDTLELKAHA